MRTREVFTIIGGFIGVPMSYYFQPEYVRLKMGGIGPYMEHLGSTLKEGELLSNVILSMAVYAAVGFAIGYVIDQLFEPVQESKQIQQNGQTQQTEPAQQNEPNELENS